MRKPLRVLLVEDNEDDAFFLIRELKKQGFDPQWQQVQTEESMLDALKQGSWDVVISDYRLPCFSGPDALRVLKTWGRDLPFIVISGTVGEEVVVETMKAGAHDYLLKGNMVRLGATIEREIREAAIRKERAQVERLFALSQDMLCIADLEGNLLRVNPAFEKTVGFSERELLELSVWDLVAQEDADEVSEKRMSLREDVGEAVFESRCRCADGTLRWLSWSLKVDRTEKLLYGVARNVSERKERERRLKGALDELARSNRELEQFAYVSSHDLQEPLRMVVSFTQLLSKRYKGKLDKDADDFIGFAVEGAKRMQVLIHDLLAFSRVGTHGRAFEPTDCAQVVADVLQNLELVIREKGAVVEVGELPVVAADKTQLGQIFQNLVENGLKFHKEETPRIQISAQRKDDQWVFLVEDNGIGIEEQFFDKIFAMFQRLHQRGEFSGSGVGLAIVKKAVERHGGTVWIESTPRQGARFFFSIPDR